MRIRSWLSDALRALSQVKEDYSRRGAYVGRHRLVVPLVIAPWSEQDPKYDLADIRWGEALKRLAERRSVALAMQ